MKPGLLDIEEISEMVDLYVSLSFKNQTLAAAHYGISRAYMSAIVNGKRKPIGAMLTDMGYEFVKIEGWLVK